MHCKICLVSKNNLLTRHSDSQQKTLFFPFVFYTGFSNCFFMDNLVDGLPGNVYEDRSEEEKEADRIRGFLENVLGSTEG